MTAVGRHSRTEYRYPRRVQLLMLLCSLAQSWSRLIGPTLKNFQIGLDKPGLQGQTIRAGHTNSKPEFPLLPGTRPGRTKANQTSAPG